MTIAVATRLAPGRAFPDLTLSDHAGNPRRLEDLVAADPAILQFYRGWWCPKEQAFFRRLVALQDEVEVAYSRIISVSVDPPATAAAFRAGLGARWTFLSDPDRVVQEELGLREVTDTLKPSLPARRLHALPRPHDPPRLQRLLVLGPAHERGAAPGHARDHACRPRRL